MYIKLLHYVAAAIFDRVVVKEVVLFFGTPMTDFLFITGIRYLLLKPFSTEEVRIVDESKEYVGQDKLRMI